MPARWTRTDEWYNFQNPVNPVVGGGGTDYSPRDSDVKVLATVDETTYGEDDGNATDDDHPVAWCSNFDGGRAWYTAMGHTQGSFAEPEFRTHLLGGLRTAAGAEADCGPERDAAPQPPQAADFEKVPLDDDTANPMELDIAPDGRVFYIERDGARPDLEAEHGADGDGRHDPGHAEPGERPARHPARPGLRHDGQRLPQPTRRCRTPPTRTACRASR